MRWLRNLIYRRGLRPKPGSIFFSPSLSLVLSINDMRKKNLRWSQAQFISVNGEPILMHPCLVCGMVDEEKPMCFKGEDWCCEKHRKIIMGELPAEEE